MVLWFKIYNFVKESGNPTLLVEERLKNSLQLKGNYKQICHELPQKTGYDKTEMFIKENFLIFRSPPRDLGLGTAG